MNRLRTWLYLLFLIPTLWTVGGSHPAQAQNGDVESIATFFEPLSPYGDWMYTPEYGWVWAPWDQAPDWRPYTQGHWVWTDEYGWMWSADEPWGWAAYHYGRWAWLGGVWVWVPDVRWAPAWVAWRYTDSYVGWAPLPPGAAMGMYSGTVNISVNIGWQYWVFVPGAYIMMPNIYTYYLPAPQVQVIYYRAVPATRYSYYNGAVVCLGVHHRYVSTWIGGPVPVSRITYSRSPGPTVVVGGSVSIYRTPPPPGPSYRTAPPPPQRAVPSGMRTYVATPPPPSATRQPVGPAPSLSSPQGGSRGGSSYPPPPAGSTRGSNQGGQKGGSNVAPPPPAGGSRGSSGPHQGGSGTYQAPAPSQKGTNGTYGGRSVYTPAAAPQNLANPTPYRVPDQSGTNNRGTTTPEGAAYSAPAPTRTPTPSTDPGSPRRSSEARPIPSSVPTWSDNSSRAHTPTTPTSSRSTATSH